MSQIPDSLRDAVQMWVELAVHKFNAADGVVIMGDCSAESVDEILQLIQAHDAELREKVLGAVDSCGYHDECDHCTAAINALFEGGEG